MGNTEMQRRSPLAWLGIRRFTRNLPDMETVQYTTPAIMQRTIGLSPRLWPFFPDTLLLTVVPFLGLHRIQQPRPQ